MDDALEVSDCAVVFCFFAILVTVSYADVTSFTNRFVKIPRQFLAALFCTIYIFSWINRLENYSDRKSIYHPQLPLYFWNLTICASEIHDKTTNQNNTRGSSDKPGVFLGRFTSYPVYNEGS